MIEEINIYKTGSYDGEMQTLQQLKNFNYFYGANGAGKTTISKIISNKLSFPTCSLRWKNGNELISFVYNRDFVESNFSQNKIKGVFTLGSDAKGIEEKISELNDDMINEKDSLLRKMKVLDGDGDNIGALNELALLEEEIKKDCWKQKVKHDVMFQKAFEGLRNSSEKFKQRVLNEYVSNSEALLTYDELCTKSKKIFQEKIEISALLPLPDFSGFSEIIGNEVWQEKILGKNDVSVADLIRILNNSDWVKDGMFYYEKSSPKCPFCQQSTNDGLLTSLSEYFDASYNSKKEMIHRLKEAYLSSFSSFTSYFNTVLQMDCAYLDKERFTAKVEILKSLFSANIVEAERKYNSLSEVVYFLDVGVHCDELIEIVESANEKISENNLLASNKKSEHNKLCGQIWSFIVKGELSDDLKRYHNSKAGIERKIGGLKTGITASKEKIERIKLKISEEESKQTSVHPTIDTINNLLRSFGFKNFELSASDDKNHYVIIREGGVDASKTLSEGERTFITFLYFYNLIKGSNNSTGILDERIVVFDDPISSLDSDILFIVTSLMKNLINEIRDKKSCIKQIFFLTHNIYFHKELTFNIKRSSDCAMSDETFWVVKKKNKTSFVEKHSVNPVKTSYDLLWSELRGENINCSTIQNTLRRILENYFKILGGMDIKKFEGSFEGHEKMIFSSLISWINDGSHFCGDDLYVSLDEDLARKHMITFQKIFEYSENAAHYKMMMGESYKPLEKEHSLEELASSASANDESNTEILPLSDTVALELPTEGDIHF